MQITHEALREHGAPGGGVGWGVGGGAESRLSGSECQSVETRSGAGSHRLRPQRVGQRRLCLGVRPSRKITENEIKVEPFGVKEVWRLIRMQMRCGAVILAAVITRHQTESLL